MGDNPYLWSPGVKLGVAPNSEFHLTECFGPVLGIMRATDLDEAIKLQNAPRYGLTGGIHTLEDSEAARWLEHVRVGNAYVNRHITGAIVQRQPFGGWKRSAIGPGAKAGGPNSSSNCRWARNSTGRARSGTGCRSERTRAAWALSEISFAWSPLAP
jgi:RHH-type proline utilization regulon transcriptional repressor/proline dehydrogenase/delta 1-pyrroline-5-carboxylate dehydrogenase